MRQDAVIQRIDTTANIHILEPIIRFHIYAAQRYELNKQLLMNFSLKKFREIVKYNACVIFLGCVREIFQNLMQR